MIDKVQSYSYNNKIPSFTAKQVRPMLIAHRKSSPDYVPLNMTGNFIKKIKEYFLMLTRW